MCVCDNRSHALLYIPFIRTNVVNPVNFLSINFKHIWGSTVFVGYFLLFFVLKNLWITFQTYTNVLFRLIESMLYLRKMHFWLWINYYLVKCNKHRHGCLIDNVLCYSQCSTFQGRNCVDRFCFCIVWAPPWVFTHYWLQISNQLVHFFPSLSDREISRNSKQSYFILSFKLSAYIFRGVVL